MSCVEESYVCSNGGREVMGENFCIWDENFI